LWWVGFSNCTVVGDGFFFFLLLLEWVLLFFTQGQSSEVRQAAGLMLKNNLKSSYQSMPLAYQQYIKAELRPCLGASDKQVRATVAIVVSALVQQGNGQDWPEIFQAFVQCLDSNDYNHMEGALDSLSKVHISS
jgi:transportin-1